MKTIVKNLYGYLPLKKYLFSLIKQVWIPPRNIYQHLHFEGVINIPIDKEHSFKMQHYGYQIENEIFWDGLENGWEKLSFKLWIEMCKESTVILDIGSNTGVYALMARSLNPKAQVYAFEPLDFIFSKLTRNCDLNSYSIDCIEKACSNFKGEAKVFLPKGAEHVTSVTVNKSLLDKNRVTDEKIIKTVRLDEFIEQNKISKIDLIKLDVETHEPEVLEGMGKYLALFKPTMLIEILEDEVGEKVEEILKGLDYLYFDVDEISQINRVDHLRKSSHFNYFICQPEIARKLKLS
jgi:FkbM family methyltransferase